MTFPGRLRRQRARPGPPGGRSPPWRSLGALALYGQVPAAGTFRRSVRRSGHQSPGLAQRAFYWGWSRNWRAARRSWTDRSSASTGKPADFWGSPATHGARGLAGGRRVAGQPDISIAYRYNEYKQTHQAPPQQQTQQSQAGPAVRWSQRLADIGEAYRDILGREADPSGLANYANSGWSLTQIRSSLFSSQEYQQKRQGQQPFSSTVNSSPVRNFSPVVNVGPVSGAVGAHAGETCNVSASAQGSCSVGLQCGVGGQLGFCGSLGTCWGPSRVGCSVVTCCAQLASVSCGVGVAGSGSASVGPQPVNWTIGRQQSLGAPSSFNYDKPADPYRMVQQRMSKMSGRR